MGYIEKSEMSDGFLLRPTNRYAYAPFRHMETPAAELVKEIEAFAKRWHMAESTFGKKATGDGELLGDLRKGREPRTRTVRKIQDFMSKYRG